MGTEVVPILHCELPCGPDLWEGAQTLGSSGVCSPPISKDLRINWKPEGAGSTSGATQLSVAMATSFPFSHTCVCTHHPCLLTKCLSHRH